MYCTVLVFLMFAKIKITVFFHDLKLLKLHDSRNSFWSFLHFFRFFFKETFLKILFPLNKFRRKSKKPFHKSFMEESRDNIYNNISFPGRYQIEQLEKSQYCLGIFFRNPFSQIPSDFYSGILQEGSLEAL